MELSLAAVKTQPFQTYLDSFCLVKNDNPILVMKLIGTIHIYIYIHKWAAHVTIFTMVFQRSSLAHLLAVEVYLYLEVNL